jgi:cytochrome c556
MAITRYLPAKGPDGKHANMDKNSKGAFVKYSDHKEKTQHLRARVLELEAMLYGDAKVVVKNVAIFDEADEVCHDSL